MATINPRPQGDGKIRYQAIVRRKGHKPHTRTFSRKRDAERWAHAIEVEMDQGGYVDRREGQVTSLADLIERYLREVVSKRDCWRQKTNRLRAIKKRAPFSRKPISAVTPTDVDSWVDMRLTVDEVATNTARNDLVDLSALYQHAMKVWRIVDNNPVRAIEWPPQGRGRKRRLEGDEETRLLEHAPPQEAAFIKLFIGTAMRFSEALSITDKALRDGYLHLPKTKNGDERDVPLPDDVIEALKACPVDLKTRRLFPWSYWQWRYRWMKICKAAEIEDLRTHDLRHEGISRLYELGFDTFAVMAISGHKTVQQSAGYTHLRVDKLKAQMDAAVQPPEADSA